MGRFVFMSDKQLPLPWGEDPERDQLERDITYVRFEITIASNPPTFEELSQQLNLPKNRLFAAISALHKANEIGWSSRATRPEGSRATNKLEFRLNNDSEVARPSDQQVARPLKCKFFKKGKSLHKYLHLCSGKKRICYIGGRKGSVKAQQYKEAVESAIASHQFSDCQTKKDYQAVVRKIKQNVDF